VKNLLRFVQFIWLLPMTILVWAGYVLPLWVTGQVKYDGTFNGCIRFRLNDSLNTWYTRLWSAWAGWSGPCVMVYKSINERVDRNTFHHEYRHCWQQFWFGPLHYPLYGINFIAFKLFTNKDPYTDNYFEEDARSYASKKMREEARQ
jgi:hypothetical protein